MGRPSLPGNYKQLVYVAILDSTPYTNEKNETKQFLTSAVLEVCEPCIKLTLTVLRSYCIRRWTPLARARSNQSRSLGTQCHQKRDGMSQR